VITKLKFLSLNQRLALLACILGVLALVAGSRFRGQKVTIDLKELARAIESENDHVSADQVAEWIMLKSPVRVIDLRDSTAFASYHIPTAENLTIEELLEEHILRDTMLVLYSEGGIHAAQAWMLLKAKGRTNIYTLKGGFTAWKEDILFPANSKTASPEERVRFARRKALSEYFGVKTPAVENGRSIRTPKHRPARPVNVEGDREKSRDGC
jgi:rhodanese-related sulfurtransferase